MPRGGEELWDSPIRSKKGALPGVSDSQEGAPMGEKDLMPGVNGEEGKRLHPGAPERIHVVVEHKTGDLPNSLPGKTASEESPQREGTPFEEGKERKKKGEFMRLPKRYSPTTKDRKKRSSVRERRIFPEQKGGDQFSAKWGIKEVFMTWPEKINGEKGGGKSFY